MKLHVIGPFRRPTVLLLFLKIVVTIEYFVTGTGRLSVFSENNRPRRPLLATHVDQLCDGQTQQCVYKRRLPFVSAFSFLIFSSSTLTVSSFNYQIIKASIPSSLVSYSKNGHAISEILGRSFQAGRKLSATTNIHCAARF
jgi:hypothetical protein